MKNTPLALLLCSQLWAGQAAFVQTVNATESSTTATTLAVTTNVNVMAGSLLAIGIAVDGANSMGGAGIHVSTVSDGTNTWAHVVDAANNGGTIKEQAEIWAASNVTAGAVTVTITISGAPGTNGGIQACLTEFAGVDTGSVASITNTSGSSTGTSTSATTGNITTSQATLLFSYTNTTVINSGDAAFRVRQIGSPGNICQDRLKAAAGTYAATAAISSSDQWTSLIAAFNVTTGLSTGIADVQSASGPATNATLITANTETGNTLVSTFTCGTSTDALTAIKDGATSFVDSTNSPASQASAGKIWLRYLVNSASGARTITLTYTACSGPGWVVLELFGVATASVLDIGNSFSTASTSTTVASPSITTTKTDVLIGVGAASNAITGTSGNWSNTGVIGGDLTIFQNSAAAGPVNPNFTQSPAGTWATLIAGFKTAAVATTAPSRLPMVGVGY